MFVFNCELCVCVKTSCTKLSAQELLAVRQNTFFWGFAVILLGPKASSLCCEQYSFPVKGFVQIGFISEVVGHYTCVKEFRILVNAMIKKWQWKSFKTWHNVHVPVCWNDSHELLWYLCQKELRIQAVSTHCTAFGCSCENIGLAPAHLPLLTQLSHNRHCSDFIW